MSTFAASPRQIALDVCFQVAVRGLSLNELLEKQLQNLESDRDRAFCSELCFGFCRYYFVLHNNLKTLLKKPLKSRDRDVQIIILLGLYQIRFMRVEDHAAVNESVNLLQRRKKVWAKGLVNAVLRSYIRALPGTVSESEQQLSKQEHYLAYPDWIIEKVKKDWPEHSAQILQAGNQRAPMVLRVNLQKISRSEYLRQLTDLSIDAREHPYVEQAVILQNPETVERLPGFTNGLVSVQDAAAQLAADLLDCEPGMKVLDACAAPGGKTLHILQSAAALQVTALDKDKQRLERVTENLQRAGESAKLIAVDAAQPDSWFDGTLYDRILLDAPCSASGIIRRHPDIRLLRQADDVSGLVDQQKRLLSAMWPLLKPGGRLLYSTCSMFKDENEYQVEQFISEHDNCVELPLNTVQWGLSRPAGRQILPGYFEMDGFYYAFFEKKAI
ncbi:MAG: 16S rRNA (cytosine(967)-C(5))-methyltransferase RsmB [Gammaproteobacteria bacterium]|nr:16S rRNA (cytosine(967)-C(5))-methyltransferase RsmB [Gammaproteobacteria bacterium]